MTFGFYDNDPTSAVLSATQNATQGYSESAWIDISNCSLTLGPGTWFVYSNFESIRAWINTGAGGTGRVMAAGGIFKSDNTEYARGIVNVPVIAGGSDRQESSCFVCATLTFTSTTTVKLRGWMTVSGTNFASGFRWDSGILGLPTKIHAIRIGP